MYPTRHRVIEKLLRIIGTKKKPYNVGLDWTFAKYSIGGVKWLIEVTVYIIVGVTKHSIWNRVPGVTKGNGSCRWSLGGAVIRDKVRNRFKKNINIRVFNGLLIKAVMYSKRSFVEYLGVMDHSTSGIGKRTCRKNIYNFILALNVFEYKNTIISPAPRREKSNTSTL